MQTTNMTRFFPRFQGHVSSYWLNKQISACVRDNDIKKARELFDEYPDSRNVVSWNSLINCYIKSRKLSEAQCLFDEMPQRDVVSWNTMLSGFRDVQNPEKAYNCFLKMMKHGYDPDELTFSVVITTFLNPEHRILIPQLHALVVRLGFNLNSYLGSALMRAYVSLGDRQGFLRVFDEIPVKDVAPYNVLILGYIESGLIDEAKKVFEKMPMKNSHTWSTMINGYMKNKMINEARDLFQRLEIKDVVSWTAMIRGFAQCDKFVEALEIFLRMMRTQTRPNRYTFSCIIDACAGSSSLVIGVQLHSWILKVGMIPHDIILSTSLVDMYAKCGEMESASMVFTSIPNKNLASWNSIIGGYARNGLASEALHQFDTMVRYGVLPDEVSFINVLSACVHGGMVKEGEELFNSMKAEYGVQAEMEHYSCMVDLYGRAGELRKAEDLINSMPFEPDVVVWGALLGACGLYSSPKMGQIAAIELAKVEKDHPAIYNALMKIYSNDTVAFRVPHLESMMRTWQQRKQKAGSWIESPA